MLQVPAYLLFLLVVLVQEPRGHGFEGLLVDDALGHIQVFAIYFRGLLPLKPVVQTVRGLLMIDDLGLLGAFLEQVLDVTGVQRLNIEAGLTRSPLGHVAGALDFDLVELGLELDVSLVDAAVALVEGEDVVDVLVAVVGSAVVLILRAEAVVVRETQLTFAAGLR